jgi:DNA-binding winged helix-turn-helix (wHTH) protein
MVKYNTPRSQLYDKDKKVKFSAIDFKLLAFLCQLGAWYMILRP